MIDDKFLIYKTKANIFNKILAVQCTPLKNDIVLPTSQTLLTSSRLSTSSNKPNVINFIQTFYFKFQWRGNNQIIKNLNVYKAHGNDNISVRMINKSILNPLILLYKNSTQSSYYPDIWKRSNVIPVHKKDDKRLINNYRPKSLLPIFGKIFEKIIFKRIYNFLL